jgi:mxaC protein
MMLFGLEWAFPLVLFLLPVALLPWFNNNLDKTVAWTALVPHDPLSRTISLALKVLASVAIAGLLLAVASPAIPERTVERFGEGAEIV